MSFESHAIIVSVASLLRELALTTRRGSGVHIAARQHCVMMIRREHLTDLHIMRIDYNQLTRAINPHCNRISLRSRVTRACLADEKLSSFIIPAVDWNINSIKRLHKWIIDDDKARTYPNQSRCRVDAKRTTDRHRARGVSQTTQSIESTWSRFRASQSVAFPVIRCVISRQPTRSASGFYGIFHTSCRRSSWKLVLHCISVSVRYRNSDQVENSQNQYKRLHKIKAKLLQ